MKKNLSTLLLVALMLVVVSACGGSPTGPSSTPAPNNPPSPAPPAQPSQLTLTPGSASMSINQSLTFTASGADGRTYSFAAGPAWILRVDQTTPNSVKVTRIGYEADYGWVIVSGWNGSTVVEQTARINLK